MDLSIIVAMARNRVIGIHNRLPWRLPADLSNFRRLTMGHTVLMGRLTFQSIGKPLAGRKNVVLTSRLDFSAEGCTVVHSVAEALELSKTEQVFVIGGARLYAEFLPFAERLYVTRVEAELEGDALFPETDCGEWVEEDRREREPDRDNPFPQTFLVYRRKGAG